MNYSQRIFILKILFPVVGAVALFLALVMDWSQDEQVAQQFTQDEKVFDDNKVAAQGPSVDIETADGDRYELSAQTVESIDSDTELFSGETVAVDMQVGGTDIAITSENVEMQKDKNIAIFRDNVVGEIDQEYKIETEELKADIKNRSVSGEKRVRVERQDAKVEADSFELTGPKEARQMRFEGNVSGTLFVKGKKND